LAEGLTREAAADDVDCILDLGRIKRRDVFEDGGFLDGAVVDAGLDGEATVLVEVAVADVVETEQVAGK